MTARITTATVAGPVVGTPRRRRRARTGPTAPTTAWREGVRLGVGFLAMLGFLAAGALRLGGALDGHAYAALAALTLAAFVIAARDAAAPAAPGRG